MTAIDKYACKSIGESNIISTIRRYHPIFKRLSFQGAKMVFTHGKLKNLKAQQLVYNEGLKESMLYLIAYGRIVIRTGSDGILGIINSSDSIGEEALFMLNYEIR